MNKTTHAIRNKGYSLKEFCELNLISLRTYRRYEISNKAKLNEMIKELTSKGES